MSSEAHILESEAGFSEQVERYRPEMRLHCYRMLGSLEDSEDAVQETFLRAWRRRDSFEGRASFRAWLYRIATNACLDAIGRRQRSLQTAQGPEVSWLQPYPDRMLEELAASEPDPDAAIVSKETVELAFLAAIQHLPPRQRAVLIVRDVLDWSSKDTAALLEASVASVNSALQRARATLKRHLPERRLEWAAGLDPSREERELLERYMNATERGDAQAFVEMMREHARFSMPPEPGTWVGNRAIVAAWQEGGAFDAEAFGRMRALPARANMQPAVACYVKHPGEPDYRPFALDVLRIEDGEVAEIVTFPKRLFAAFELPPRL
jgi:RNA polymerase sigma-70 factor, ECF subfamily